MKVKLAIGMTILALMFAAVANAAEFRFTIAAPVKAGAHELTPGDYRVRLQGSVGVVIQEQTSKSFAVLVRLESGDQTFDRAAIEVVKQDGADHLKAIQIGHSNTRVLFE